MSYETGVIKEFRGEYAFLSNYATTPFEWRRVAFHSGEQAFAYAKTFFAIENEKQMHLDSYVGEGEYFRDYILKAKGPGEAKKLGRQVQINVDEWDKHKVQYMREIVHAKFMTGEGLVGPLCNTGARMLIEGNDWGDRFWGRVYENGRWVGLNVLGVILMEERGWWSRGDEGRP